jgi:hypothetical protein
MADPKIENLSEKERAYLERKLPLDVDTTPKRPARVATRHRATAFDAAARHRQPLAAHCLAEVRLMRHREDGRVAIGNNAAERRGAL